MADGQGSRLDLKNTIEPLPREFFQRPTLSVAGELLGCLLVHREPDGAAVSGWISETEAYVGSEDLASHGRFGRTESNDSMWGPAGCAYVYFTYGMHWMLNLVTEQDGTPAAVLLRAVVPSTGLDRIRRRRRGRPEAELTDGPAKLCQAFGIDGSFDGLDLCRPDSPLTVTRGQAVEEQFVTRGPRVGLNNVPEPWFSKPWRFRLANEKAAQWTETKGDR